ncbi:MAG: hypothetical protein ABI180_13080 [Microcoleus sp.]
MCAAHPTTAAGVYCIPAAVFSAIDSAIGVKSSIALSIASRATIIGETVLKKSKMGVSDRGFESRSVKYLKSTSFSFFHGNGSNISQI